MSTLIERIRQSNTGRLGTVLPIKYDALKEGPFRFFRGTAPLFYEDLSKAGVFASGPKTWICGDLHLENYGTYKGDNRLIYFDINDFDECILAPVALEILRVITSIYVASGELQMDMGRADSLANTFVTKYFSTIINGKAHSFQRETADGLICDLIESVGKRKSREVIEKRTELHNGMMRISMIPGKTIQTPAGKAAEIRHAFIGWNAGLNNVYELMDIASRIMGTGSLGLERYILLCFNRELNKPLLLDLKEAADSCVLSYFDFKQPAWDSSAQRVIKIQSLLQDTPPAFLHNVLIGGKSYVIKELQPSQDKLDLKEVSQRVHKFEASITAMADITASAHLRATGRYTSETGDALIESVKALKKPDLLAYAKDYSTKVAQDYHEYISAAAT